MIRHSPRSRRAPLSALQCRRAQKISRFAYLYPFCLLVEPSSGQRLKKRGPGIGETPDSSHYAFEKRSLAGKNPPARAVKLLANFIKSLRALDAEVVASLSICCRSVVAWWVGPGGSAGWRFGSFPVHQTHINRKIEMKD